MTVSAAAATRPCREIDCAGFDRRNPLGPDAMMDDVRDDQIADAILTLAAERAPATLCPSEVARALTDDWRPLMPRIRAVAAGLPQIEATQGGTAVDPVAARGPIRLRQAP
ncbi:DUF3253 domain-containing protein [Jannaschia sp. 2305UL9-9]|uniref:DUF3253 domain-containing protein n=1 Tax=Jannaschia sp. 2305UL9-9 TaxID=3121638 RepID=UPI0035296206